MKPRIALDSFGSSVLNVYSIYFIGVSLRPVDVPLSAARANYDVALGSKEEATWRTSCVPEVQSEDLTEGKQQAGVSARASFISITCGSIVNL